MLRMRATRRTRGDALPHAIIATLAFLTLVDLFATQAILPSLATAYGVSPAAMGAAVNASTMGMAVAGLGIAFLGHRIDRRLGVALSLLLLSVPTALLAIAPDLISFAALRVAQGVLMSAAFSLTLAHLGERGGMRNTAGAFAAYVTGNVLSNLVGRSVSAGVAEHAGLGANFLLFAALNLAGAILAIATLGGAAAPSRMSGPVMPPGRTMSAWRTHWRNTPLRADFAIGFCILFAFIGTFTYVNFLLVGPRFGLTPMELGFVYLVFLPSVVTTPQGGRLARSIGTSRTIQAGLFVAAAGLALTLSSRLWLVLTGLSLLAAGTFLAQAAATGFVSRAAMTDRAAASGIYLASYFSGGLIGTVVLGAAYDRFGWVGCVAGVAIGLLTAAVLARLLEEAGSVPSHVLEN